MIGNRLKSDLNQGRLGPRFRFIRGDKEVVSEGKRPMSWSRG